MQNYDFYVWSTSDGDTAVYHSLSELIQRETPFSANIDENVVEIGVLIPTADQRFINTHEHAFVKIRILKDTHFAKKGEIKYVETDSSNLQSPREVVDYLKDDEFEILGAFYGIPLAILNYASPYADKEKDVESIVENRIKEFEGLGIHLKKDAKKDTVESRIVKILSNKEKSLIENNFSIVSQEVNQYDFKIDSEDSICWGECYDGEINHSYLECAQCNQTFNSSKPDFANMLKHLKNEHNITP